MNWLKVICWLIGHNWQVFEGERHCTACGHKPKDNGDVIFCPESCDDGCYELEKPTVDQEGVSIEKRNKLKYKIRELFKGKDFWTRPAAPKGYREARTCENCGKVTISSTYPCKKFICNEVTEYVGFDYATGIPRGYSRQPFETMAMATCDEHRYMREMEEESE